MKNLFNLIKHAKDDGGASGSGTIANMSPQQVQTIASDIMGAQNLRDLPIVSYTGVGGVQSLSIPNNSSYKSIILTLIGSLTATYAAGSPVVSPLSFFSRICSLVEVKASASRSVKSLNLHILRNMNALARGSFPRQAFAKGAGIRSTSSLATDERVAGTYAFGATTQDLVVNEGLRIEFENPFAWREKMTSQLYCRDLTDPRIFFTFLDISNILQDGNGATVTYSNVSFTVQVSMVEDRQAGPQNNSFDFVETVLQDQLTAQATNRRFALNAGQITAGLAFLTINGDTNKNLSDRLITSLAIRTNGVDPQWEGNFRSAQLDNKMRFGVSDDQWVSGAHGLQGFAYLSFLKDGDARTGLDARPEAGVQTLDLIYSSGVSAGLDAQTYPANVFILQQTMVPVARR